MNPILQIVLFTIVLIISATVFLKPEPFLNWYYWWRIKGEKEYAKSYLTSIKISSVVICIVAIGWIIDGILAL